jgi:hypothetical protein
MAVIAFLCTPPPANDNFFSRDSSAPGTSPDPEKEIHNITNFLKLPKLGDYSSTGCWLWNFAQVAEVMEWWRLFVVWWV